MDEPQKDASSYALFPQLLRGVTSLGEMGDRRVRGDLRPEPDGRASPRFCVLCASGRLLP